ncbi:MAG: hypothetical protein HFF09_04200 [Oscillospiraceae bacterium]|nr:hypothetical protein [Oscillospiraceae bacterium]
MRGGGQVGESVMTDAQGRYTFTDVPEGRYNVVATKSGVTKTILVELTADVAGKTIKMPEGSRNSVVKVEGAGTPAAVVGGVDAVAEAEPVGGGDTVTVTLTIEAKNAPDDKAEIDAALAEGTRGVLYLDLSLLKQVNGGEAENIRETGDKVLEIVIPYNFTGKENVAVYRRHGGDDAEALLEAETGADGTYLLDRERGHVTIYAAKFSTYAIGYTTKAQNPTPPLVAPPRPAWNPFVDMASSDWFHNGVKYVYEQGLMTGTDAAHFAPKLDVSRGMMAVLLWRLEGEPSSQHKVSFTDVAADAYYAKAVAWADEQGYVIGYDRSRFAPDKPITREELAALLWRYAGRPVPTGSLSAFTDGDEASGYAREALRWAVEQGIVTGRGGGVLDPTGKATRAETAEMLRRYRTIRE